MSKKPLTWKDYGFYGIVGLCVLSTVGSIGKIIGGPQPPQPVAQERQTYFKRQENPPAPTEPSLTPKFAPGVEVAAPRERATGYGVISERTGRPRTQFVRGYTRKDGTRVEAHYRSRR